MVIWVSLAPTWYTGLESKEVNFARADESERLGRRLIGKFSLSYVVGSLSYYALSFFGASGVFVKAFCVAECPM